MRRILCVTAHPDDEAAAFGGAVALYSRQGVHCRLVCLTAGEAARNRGGAVDNAALQALRRAELAHAAKLLGFARHDVWDLPDAHLAEADFYATVGRLVAVLRDERPHLVLTFGPEGSVTAHPDHALAGTFATAAFHFAAQQRPFPANDDAPAFQPRRLYYATAPAQPPGFPPVFLPPPDVALPVEAFLERKIQAFQCHTTQAPLFDRVEGFMRMTGGRELFHLAAGVPLPATGAVDDLWAGLDD
jgi:LmbE family N-acetylglucosaminyl deacetylase